MRPECIYCCSIRTPVLLRTHPGIHVYIMHLVLYLVRMHARIKHRCQSNTHSSQINTSFDENPRSLSVSLLFNIIIIFEMYRRRMRSRTAFVSRIFISHHIVREMVDTLYCRVRDEIEPNLTLIPSQSQSNPNPDP